MQYNDFGSFIRKKRIELGLSLNKFAIQNEIEPAILCRIETKKQDIKLGVLAKIATGFKQPLSAFIKEYETFLHSSSIEKHQ